MLAAQNGWFGPYVDGRLIPAHPFDPAAPALSADVPVIVGSNLHDSSYNVSNANLDEAGLLAELRNSLGERAPGIVEAYRAVYPRTTPYELLGQINSDRGVRRNSIQLAERKAAQGGAPAYMYMLTYESVPFGGKFGSTHGTEMPLFYHNLDRWPIAGTSPAAEALAAKMAGAYIAFATTGRPTIPGFGEWPAYNAATHATVMFDTNTRVENAPDRELLALVAQP
jgi:para-nitrobenzyl esterase